ncbi:DUF805 domain-containing protein [Aeromonas jandaei]|uniref:DUF805 domain-containing protein n=1 Tax=Aeromonas jandaei TaxID=650 RepID=UPI002AA0E1D1|nr:DUF805 domain-containing protein [Aeromonas jandaei]
MYWYLLALRKTLVFRGRSSRKEFWMFVLVNTFLMSLLELAVTYFELGSTFEQVFFVVYGVTTISLLAAAVRRFNDSSANPALLLLILIPVFGAFVVLYYLVRAGSKGTNRHGCAITANNALIS